MMTTEPMRRVTPLAGVWIEIFSTNLILTSAMVTPLAGVWIEIRLWGKSLSILMMSHPSRVCGLKFSHLTKQSIERVQSHPSRVCGLKYQRWELSKGRRGVTPLAGVWIEI